jgi:hypothetical protein
LTTSGQKRLNHLEASFQVGEWGSPVHWFEGVCKQTGHGV